MKKLIKLLLLSLYLSSSAQADFFELSEVYLNYRNYGLINSSQKSLLVYPESPKEAINVNLNMNLFYGYVYAQSNIETYTTSAQFRSIGLQERIGFYLTNNIEIGFNHRSQHTIDRAIPYMNGFPSEDCLEFRLYLYKNNNQKSIF
jgi:hypothetical protein